MFQCVRRTPEHPPSRIKGASIDTDFAQEMELLKEQSVRDPDARAAYLSKLGRFLQETFTMRGFLGNCARYWQRWHHRGIAHYNCQHMDDAYESFLAQRVVYVFDGRDMVGESVNLLVNDPLTKGKHLVEYVVHSYFREKEGLNAYGLIPKSLKDRKVYPPRLMFRGTKVKSHLPVPRKNSLQATQKVRDMMMRQIEVLKLPTGVTADRRRAIARASYQHASGRLQRWLEIHTKYQPAIVSGHSLGGVYAQRLACDPRSTGRIAKLRTVNSPMLDKQSVRGADLSGIDSVHLMMRGDFVTKVGERFAPGKVRIFRPRIGPAHISKDIYHYATRGRISLINDHDCVSLYAEAHKIKKRFLNCLRSLLRLGLESAREVAVHEPFCRLQNIHAPSRSLTRINQK